MTMDKQDPRDRAKIEAAGRSGLLPAQTHYSAGTGPATPGSGKRPCTSCSRKAWASRRSPGSWTARPCASTPAPANPNCCSAPIPAADPDCSARSSPTCRPAAPKASPPPPCSTRRSAPAATAAANAPCADSWFRFAAPNNPRRRRQSRPLARSPHGSCDLTTSSGDGRTGLKDACTRCPDLAALTDLAHGFNTLVRQRGGHQLEAWINQAAQSSFAEVRGFATGLRSDFDAVRTGLTQQWSSGAVEGNINRVKTIKRQMYGRANLDLLRIRILHSR
jgi:hypothetical protein